MGMLAAGHQPAFMPWLGLIHKIASCDVFISWDDVQAEDSGFENRQEVLTAKGRQWLTVPVKKSRDRKIRELEVAGTQPWRRKHWRTIELAYSKAPFWNDHAEWLRWFYDQDWPRLAEANDTVLTHLLDVFQVRGRRFARLSDLKVKTMKTEAIIDACRAVGANQYLFGAKGVDYADKQSFLAAGIEPFVQEYDCKPYPQWPAIVTFPEYFEPRLWAFDLLMNVPREEAIRIMMAGGTVKRMP